METEKSPLQLGSNRFDFDIRTLQSRISERASEFQLISLLSHQTTYLIFVLLFSCFCWVIAKCLLSSGSFFFGKLKFLAVFSRFYPPGHPAISLQLLKSAKLSACNTSNDDLLPKLAGQFEQVQSVKKSITVNCSDTGVGYTGIRTYRTEK